MLSTTNTVAATWLKNMAVNESSLQVGYFHPGNADAFVREVIQRFEMRIEKLKSVRNKTNRMFFEMGASIAAVRELKSWESESHPEAAAKKLNELIRQYKLSKIVMAPLTRQVLKQSIQQHAHYSASPRKCASYAQNDLNTYADFLMKESKQFDLYNAVKMAADVIQSWLDQDEKPISEYIHEVLSSN